MCVHMQAYMCAQYTCAEELIIENKNSLFNNLAVADKSSRGKFRFLYSLVLELEPRA